MSKLEVVTPTAIRRVPPRFGFGSGGRSNWTVGLVAAAAWVGAAIAVAGAAAAAGAAGAAGLAASVGLAAAAGAAVAAGAAGAVVAAGLLSAGFEAGTPGVHASISGSAAITPSESSIVRRVIR